MTAGESGVFVSFFASVLSVTTFPLVEKTNEPVLTTFLGAEEVKYGASVLTDDVSDACGGVNEIAFAVCSVFVTGGVTGDGGTTGDAGVGGVGAVALSVLDAVFACVFDGDPTFVLITRS